MNEKKRVRIVCIKNLKGQLYLFFTQCKDSITFICSYWKFVADGYLKQVTFIYLLSKNHASKNEKASRSYHPLYQLDVSLRYDEK